MNGERHLVTTLGQRSSTQVGWMLAHEHVCANFAADDDHGVQAEAVIARMLPELQRAKAAGLTVIVEATAAGAARRADILAAVSRAADLPIVLATGAFKEPAKQAWCNAYSDAALFARMIHELDDGIDQTRIRAGWIKLSVTDSGILPHEDRLLSAAAVASTFTNAVVGCHTVGAALANAVLDVFEAAGGDPSRFIWIHTQTEPEFAAHLAFAQRGAWIEYDAIGTQPDEDVYVDWTLRLLDSGLGDHLLLSHDRMGYDPAQADGGDIRPYTTLTETFVPQLLQYGLSMDDVDVLLRDNPFRAYAR